MKQRTLSSLLITAALISPATYAETAIGGYSEMH